MGEAKELSEISKRAIEYAEKAAALEKIVELQKYEIKQYQEMLKEFGARIYQERRRVEFIDRTKEPTYPRIVHVLLERRFAVDDVDLFESLLRINIRLNDMR